MSVKISDAEFDLLKDYLLRKCGIDVPPQKRYLFVTRLGTCLEKNGIGSFSELYLRLAKAEDDKLDAQLIEAMTTPETAFFRDGHPFAALERRILPALADRKAGRSHFALPRLRLWSAGCCTGEEPYSMSICVKNWLATQTRFTQANVSILASDISQGALDHARRGVYSDAQVSNGVPERHREEYFRNGTGGWRVREDLRAMVYFSEVNLSRDFAHLGTFDLIFCRNVIIYFAMDLRRRIIDAFHDMLTPGGVLLLGASESLYQLSSRFESVHVGPTTYYVRRDDGDNGRGHVGRR
jgi:chemotaxis protein methyltransferase CheR